MTVNFSQYEQQYGLPAGLLNAVMHQESGGNPNAVSPKGAVGLFQIMPETAKELGIDPLDPTQAAMGAAKYLSDNYRKFGDWDLALAAYNAGAGNVEKYNGIPPFPETQNYVSKIRSRLGEGVQVASNDMTGWRGRAAPATSDATAQAGGWRSRATPATEASTRGWRSRAQLIQPPTAQPAPSVTEDLAKTVASNLVKGGVDAVMILPNLMNEVVAGPQYLYEGLLGENRKDFKPYQPFLSSEDVVSGSAIDYQPQTTAGKIAEIPTRLLSNVTAPAVINKAGNAALRAGKTFVESPTTQNLIKSEAGVKEQVLKPPIKTASDLDEMSNAAFTQAREIGGNYKPQDVSIPFAKAIAEVKPRKIAGVTLTSDEQKLVSHLAEYDGLKGVNLTFDDIQRLDSGLTQKISANFIDARTGQPDANGRKLMILQTKLRNILDDLPENAANDALRNANKLWKAKIILNDLDTVAERASMTQNVRQALRTGYKNLYMDKDRIRGWPEEAKKLLKVAAIPGVKDEFLIPISSRMLAIIAGGTGDIGGAATAHIVGAAGRGFGASVAAKQGAAVQQSVVDDALASLREVKVPEKSNIPLMLSSPDKMSPLPMSDTQVNISRKLMEGTPLTGADVSGGAIKPPVSQKLKIEESTDWIQGKEFKNLQNRLLAGEISQNKFINTIQERFGLRASQARSLVKEIVNYGDSPAKAIKK